MRAHQAEFRVVTMARLFGVSSSGFYAWLRRRRSARSLSDDDLSRRVREICQRSRGTYGAPRIHAELAGSGVCVGRKRVARLMREAGLAGISRRKGPRTTRRDPQALPAPDLVNRRFTADAPDRLWLADITYVPTGKGFLYLAIVLGAFSRRIVAWSMASNLRTDLVLGALEMALSQRLPRGVAHHSDRGSQCTSLAFSTRCREAGVVPSMGKAGDCFDNAMAESFFASLECELIDRTPLSATAATPRGSTSATSRAGTTRIVGTPASDTDHPSTSRRATESLLDSLNVDCPRNRGNSTPGC